MTGQQLKYHRKQLGLTQAKMSLLMGMDRRNYSRLETGYDGRSPTKQHAAQVTLIVFINEINLLDTVIEVAERLKGEGAI